MSGAEERDEPKCDTSRKGHERCGIVTNQPGKYDSSQPHASVEVCGFPSCRADAMGWVHRITGQPAHYIRDKTRSATV